MMTPVHGGHGHTNPSLPKQEPARSPPFGDFETLYEHPRGRSVVSGHDQHYGVG